MTEPQPDLDRPADEIVRRLSADELPAHIGKFIREDGAQFGMRSSHALINPGSPLPMYADFDLYPNGSMYIRLVDCNGQIFWRKHLRSAKDGK
jgi:hypothetical protein